ncbi:MAG: MarR family transcriptional regulator [Rickettsiales bacterium]
MSVSNTQEALKLWHRIVTRSLRELPYDLSQRQTAVLLTVYMVPAPHTIRNLAERLNISKPAVCRALDALSTLDLIRRKKDEEDRRNVFIQRTVNGSVFLRDFADLMVQESKSPSADTMPLFSTMAA